jgi:hypothetical protein
MYNEIDIIKYMPTTRGTYYLPFHLDHGYQCKAVDEYESEQIALADRIRMLDIQSKAGPCITAFAHNEPIAVFGCVLLWPGVGEAWSMLSEKARRYPVTMTKAAKHFFMAVERQFNLHRLQITVKSTDKRAMGWAKTLGFVPEGLMLQYSADKEDNYIMRKQ